MCSVIPKKVKNRCFTPSVLIKLNTCATYENFEIANRTKRLVRIRRHASLVCGGYSDKRRHSRHSNRLGRPRNRKENTTDERVVPFSRRRRSYASPFPVLANVTCAIVARAIRPTRYRAVPLSRPSFRPSRFRRVSSFRQPRAQYFERAQRAVDGLCSARTSLSLSLSSCFYTYTRTPLSALSAGNSRGNFARNVSRVL